MASVLTARQKASTRRRRRRCGCCSMRSKGSARLDGWIGGGCLRDADAADARRDRRAGAVELHSLGAGRHPGRVGVFLLPDGGVLHLRRRHDAARRRPHPRHAGARAAARRRRGGCSRSPRRWSRRVFVGIPRLAMARFAWTRVQRAARPRSRATRCCGFPQAVVAFGMVLLALQFLARFIQAAARPAARGSPHARPAPVE